MNKEVPFLNLKRLHSEIRESLDVAYRRVVDSGCFIMGPELQAFESEFARYCGVDHCIGVGNGLDALKLLLQAYGIGPGDEVIVPDLSFIATANAVLMAGATPIFADIDPASLCLNPAAIAPVT